MRPTAPCACAAARLPGAQLQQGRRSPAQRSPGAVSFTTWGAGFVVSLQQRTEGQDTGSSQEQVCRETEMQRLLQREGPQSWEPGGECRLSLDGRWNAPFLSARPHAPHSWRSVPLCPRVWFSFPLGPHLGARGRKCHLLRSPVWPRALPPGRTPASPGGPLPAPSFGPGPTSRGHPALAAWASQLPHSVKS